MNDDFIERLTQKIQTSYEQEGGINHIGGVNLPSRERVFSLIKLMREILFPGYFEEEEVSLESLVDHLPQKLTLLYQRLSIEILKSDDQFTQEEVNRKTEAFIQLIPTLRQQLKKDVSAIFEGDPASHSQDEIILAYPGFQAISIYRQAHELAKLEIPVLPRLMTEISHSITGIDIHPCAQIGAYFCIDHGTGVVIGETAVIGNYVKLYQGVTIGALSVSKTQTKTSKRHPTLEDHVTVYSGTTILGGETIIGEYAIIGGNLWVTDSVPKYSKMYLTGDLKQVIKSTEKSEEE
tara:strand:+ start:313 stop:1191 length:879 start_codon:yes stop_codon:yes gene_type:complete